MEGLEHILVLDEQIEQGLEVDVRLGIDRGGVGAARPLDQAQVGPIGMPAHELGVHGDEWLLGKPADEGLQIAGLVNQGMDSHESRAAIAAARRVDKSLCYREAR